MVGIDHLKQGNLNPYWYWLKFNYYRLIQVGNNRILIVLTDIDLVSPDTGSCDVYRSVWGDPRIGPISDWYVLSVPTSNLLFIIYFKFFLIFLSCTFANRRKNIFFFFLFFPRPPLFLPSWRTMSRGWWAGLDGFERHWQWWWATMTTRMK